MKKSKHNSKYGKGVRGLAGLLVLIHLVWTSFPTSLFASSYTGGSYDGSDGTSAVAPDQTANKLYFTTQPSGAAVNQVFSQAPVVAVYDINNEPLTSISTNCTITMALLSNPTSATLGGTTTKAVTSGSASFSANSLTVNKPGTLYTLQASGSGTNCSAVTAATSNSFSITASDMKVQSILTVDAGGTYRIQSWLESGGTILTDASWGSSDITITILRADGSAATAPSYSSDDNTVFIHSWTPNSNSEIFRATVSIRYPSASPNPSYSGAFLFDTGTAGFTSSDRTTLNGILGNVQSIKTVTDGINWSDINAIKTAVGANQSQTVYDKVGTLVTRVGNYDDVSGLNTVFGKIREINTQVAKANWDDIKVFSESAINWSQMATFSKANINFTDFARMSTAGVNWSGIQALAAGQVNWLGIKALSVAGVNWLALNDLTSAGVNWQALNTMTASGINWSGLKALSEAQVNWTDLNVMHKVGINWLDIGRMSNLGVNWNDIDRMSKAGVNWNDMAKMTGAHVNWSQTINWDNLAALSNS